MITVEVLTRLFFVAERTLVRVVPEREEIQLRFQETILLLEFVTCIQKPHLCDLGHMIDGGDNYVQSMFPLQWRFVGRHVRSLQGVEPAGHEELVRHRLQREY